MAIVTEKIVKITVTEGEKRKRIDLFISNTLENTTRSRLQKLIKENLLKVNGKIVKANYIIEPFDEIELTIPVAPRPDKIEPEDIPINVVYEDDYLMLINKPHGMVVHPSPGNYTGTLVNALKHYTDELSSQNGDARSGLVHRIDKDTSGLLLIALLDSDRQFQDFFGLLKVDF